MRKKKMPTLMFMSAVLVGILALLLLVISLQGCCGVHYEPAPSLSIQEPEKRPVVPAEVWSLQDPVTKKERTVVVIDANNFFLVGASFKIDDRFIEQCRKLLAPRKDPPK